MKSWYKSTLILLLGLSACAPQSLNQPDQPLLSQPSFHDQPYQLIAHIRSGQDQKFLDQVTSRLGVVVVDSLKLKASSYFLLQLDPDKLKAQRYPRPQLTDAKPGPNLDALDLTRAAAQELTRQYREMLVSLDMNSVADPAPPQVNPHVQDAFAISQATESKPAGLFNDLTFGINSGLEGWWRTDTQVESAWNYSIGTGATAAYLDQGFVRGHPELARRMILNGHNNQTSEYVNSQPDNVELPSGDHGTASLLVGFGERDNHIPSVGVAPNARFVPYVASSVWDASRALVLAVKDHPDVIGMNMALPIYPKWDPQGEFHQYQVLKDVFAQIAAETQIPVVVPAHNYGEPVKGGPRDWIPVAWASEYDNIIGVGGVQVQAGHQIKAWFSGDLVTGINARGSNYGDGLIWAPATALDIANARANNVLPASMNGTSAACPFMTGVVALIRSRLPDLPARRLRELLLESARPVPANDLMQRPGATVPMIQAQDALKAALRSTGQNPEQFVARKLTGKMTYTPNGQHEFESEGQRWQVLPTLNSLLPGTPSEYDQQTLTVLAWTGIPPLKADQIEILHIQDNKP